MIVDAHSHFWQYDPVEYEWIGDDMSLLKRDFLPQHLQIIHRQYAVEGTIAVQARQSHEENRFLLKLAEENPSVRGVVGWVDLAADNVEENLHLFAKQPKFVGIRHMVQSEEDEEFLLRKDFNRGVGMLKKYGLAYDILIHEKQLAVATRFVERFPDQNFVLDHIAKPSIKSGVVEPWAQQIKELAANGQVFCKLSGLATEADWQTWKDVDMRPYLDAVFSAFGPDRLMFGGDWPVCLLAADYRRVLQLINGYIAEFDIEDQKKIMGLNALRFYNIQWKSPDENDR